MLEQVLGYFGIGMGGVSASDCLHPIICPYACLHMEVQNTFWAWEGKTVNVKSWTNLSGNL